MADNDVTNIDCFESDVWLDPCGDFFHRSHREPGRKGLWIEEAQKYLITAEVARDEAGCSVQVTGFHRIFFVFCHREILLLTCDLSSDFSEQRFGVLNYLTFVRSFEFLLRKSLQSGFDTSKFGKLKLRP